MMLRREITFRGRKLTPGDLILIAVALVMVVFYIAFYYLNISAGAEKSRMETEVSQARIAYEQAVQKSDLVETLKQEKARAAFPSKEKGGVYLAFDLLERASASELQIPTDAEWTYVTVPATLGEVDCLAITHTISVKGKAGQLIDFFKSINNLDIDTMVVDNMNAEYVPETDIWTITSMKVTAYTEAS